MKKRSALTVAAGLVGALLSGVIGYTMRLTGVQSVGATQAAPKPVVKTITTTVHVKKKPKVKHVSATTAPFKVVHSFSSSSKPPTTSTGGSHSGYQGDDSGEHEGGDD